MRKLPTISVVILKVEVEMILTALTCRPVSKLYKGRTTSSETGGCLHAVFGCPAELAISADYLRTSTASFCLSRVMSAKRCGLASLLLNIKGPTPSFTKLVSFAVNGGFYVTSLLLAYHID